MWRKARLLIFFVILFSTGITLSAQSVQPLYSGFTPILKSQAYRLFQTRPVTDYSKIIYLIDRFADSKIEIVYDGRYFSAPFVSRITRWFLARNYRKETPGHWIMKWCNTSMPAGNLIWIKIPNGKFRLAREVLFEELKALEDILKTPEQPAPTALQVNPVAIAQVVEAPANTPPSLEAQSKTLAGAKPKTEAVIS